MFQQKRISPRNLPADRLPGIARSLVSSMPAILDGVSLHVAGFISSQDGNCPDHIDFYGIDPGDPCHLFCVCTALEASSISDPAFWRFYLIEGSDLPPRRMLSYPTMLEIPHRESGYSDISNILEGIPS